MEPLPAIEGISLRTLTESNPNANGSMSLSGHARRALSASLLWICVLAGCSDHSTNLIDDPTATLVNGAPDWGPDGRIAFEHYPQTPEERSLGGIQIWVGEIGTPGQYITAGQNPAWSPDGTQLAFGRGADIWVVDLGTGVQTQLTHIGSCFTPDWSPDGTHIAYKVEVNHPSAPEDSAGIWMIDVRTLQRKQLLRYFGGWPCWSPKGDRLAINASIGESAASDEIALIDTTSGKLERLTFNTESERSAAWSPDGNAIVYDGGHWPLTGGLWRMAPDGSGQRLLIANGGRASWSPDGTKLIYISQNTSTGVMSLWVANADGSAAHELPY